MFGARGKEREEDQVEVEGKDQEEGKFTQSSSFCLPGFDCKDLFFAFCC